jgi:ABC-type sulfate transport system permease subunit
VGLGLAKVLEGLGMDAEGAAAVRGANWWIHVYNFTLEKPAKQVKA